MRKKVVLVNLVNGKVSQDEAKMLADILREELKADKVLWTPRRQRPSTIVTKQIAGRTIVLSYTVVE